jgi:phage terminase small subunit
MIAPTTRAPRRADKPRHGALEPPPHLSERSAALWCAVVRGPVGPGFLTLLQTALEALDRADAARQRIEADGLVGTTEATGALHAHPLLRVEKDSMTLFCRIWKDLRLTFDQEL